MTKTIPCIKFLKNNDTVKNLGSNQKKKKMQFGVNKNKDTNSNRRLVGKHKHKESTETFLNDNRKALLI